VPPATTQLRELLVDLFEGEELGMFIADYYPELENSINWGKSTTSVAHETSKKLASRGELDTTLFSILIEERPGQEGPIRETARACGVDLAGVDALAVARMGPDPTRTWLADGEALLTLGSTIEPDSETPVEGLQSIVDARAGLGDPVAYIMGVITTMRRTALVEVGGAPSGTGFLVGDNHIMTNAHVVKAVTSPPPPGLEVVALFDFYAGSLTSHAEAGRRVRGQVVAHSLPSEAEAANDNSDWNAPPDRLDYALIELEEAVATQPGGPAAFVAQGGGTPRGSFPLSTIDYDFSTTNSLVIVQHPLGEHMAMSRAKPGFTVNQTKTRVRYTANTLQGSSGSSVIDDRGRLVALHHYSARGENQGVPISAIARHLQPAFPQLVVDV
jgi:hypothetical protein